MKEFKIKRYILRLYALLFVVFVLNKFWIRPWILENNMPQLFDIIVLSLPNFIEAVMGTISIAGILLYIQFRYPKNFGAWNEKTIYFIAIFLTGIYVVLQEFKIHNLGGRNTYDPWDVVASVLGLMVTGVVLNRWGLKE